MSSCTCTDDALTRVTFGNGTVLLRCPAHEAQRWLVDGRPAETRSAMAGLRELFVEQRSARARRAAPPRRRGSVIRLPEPPRTTRDSAPPTTAGTPRVDDDSLNALLQARGLSGTWAIA